MTPGLLGGLSVIIVYEEMRVVITAGGAEGLGWECYFKQVLTKGCYNFR